MNKKYYFINNYIILTIMEIKQKDNNENKKDYTYKLKKESLFSFSKFNKYFLIPFLCPILKVFSFFFVNKIEKIVRDEENNKDKDNKNEIKIHKFEFLLAFIFSFNYILSGLLYFVDIFRIKTKTTKNNTIIYNKEESSKDLIYNNNYDDLLSKKSELKVIIILFLLPILISIILFVREFYNSEQLLDPNFIYLIFVPLFSKYILKENIYKHQIFSLIISIFPAIFIFISTLLESNNSEILFLPYQITTAIFIALS